MTALAALALAAAVVTRRPRAASRLPGNVARPRVEVAALVVVAAVLLVAAGSWQWVGFAAIAAVLSRRVLRRRSARALQRSQAADATTLAYALAAELRAGRPPGTALGAVAPQLRVLEQAVAAAGRAVSRGADLGSEMTYLVATTRCTRLQPLAAALATTAGAGGAVADLLDRIGAAFDAHDEAASELAAAVAGPKSTVAVLICLPAFGLIIGSAMGAAPLHVLLHERVGLFLVGAAALLDVAGWWWVQTILRRALRA